MNTSLIMKRSRLKPSVAPMSEDPRANTLPWIAEEYAALAHQKGLSGEKLKKFMDEKLAAAGRVVDEIHNGLKK